MKKEIPKRLSIFWGASIIVLVTGILLLVYMVKAEGEPGALPLLLVLLGIVGMVSQLRIKKIKN
jgi:hypothetical protein